nr:hypothetical protein [Legionella tunisiensis]
MEKQYEKTKGERSKGQALPNSLSRELQTIQTNDVELEPGEMLLYHGTNSEVAPLIMQNGFDEARCKYVQGNGYGPLGKGVYFTSELSKAATFSTCSECGKSGQCSCVKKGTFEPADRVVLLCKVFVGNPEIILKKGDIKERTKPAEPFDSCMALANELDPISDFRSTEVCVPKGNQIIPLYEIRFSSQPNLLRVAEWEKTIEQNGLIENKSVGQNVTRCTNLLKELAELRIISAPFATIQNQANKIEKRIDSAIEILQHQRDTFKLDDVSIEKLDIQLRDLKNFRNQLISLQKQSEDFSPNRKDPSTSLSKEPMSFSKLLNKVIRFFLPKEYALKNECAELAEAMHKKPGTPDKFLTDMTQWLNRAIERDQHKGTTFVFGTRTYPMHRILITQKMINLRDTLRDLQEKGLNPEELQTEIRAVLAKTVQELDEYGKAEPEILTSTSYKNLQAFLKTSASLTTNTVVGMNPILQGLSISSGQSVNKTETVSAPVIVTAKAKTEPSDVVRLKSETVDNIKLPKQDEKEESRPRSMSL